MGDIKDDAVIIIKERMAGPIGYILFSFIAYNWSWFYFIIFSDKTAEVKISTVLRTFDTYYGFGIPVLAGCILAVITPFLKVVMVYITAAARKLEDKKNHQIKNYLEHYVEQTNLALIRTKQEITERNSKINELITKKKDLEDEVTLQSNLLEMARKEGEKLSESKNRLASDIHSLETMMAEYRVRNAEFHELRERIYKKSSQYNQLKRQLIIFKNETYEINEYFSDVNNLYITPPNSKLESLRLAVESIHKKLASIDDEYFKELIFSFSSDIEVEIQSLKSINWDAIKTLLDQNDLPSNGYDADISGDTIKLYFQRKLTNDEKKKVISVFKQYLQVN
ncbi:hypothetical protein SLIQ_06935 [Serratia liquefaciens FK01]|nr:hypothetical protein SLIQ_06935 [Serratia liquefaciens FK01]